MGARLPGTLSIILGYRGTEHALSLGEALFVVHRWFESLCWRNCLFCVFCGARSSCYDVWQSCLLPSPYFPIWVRSAIEVLRFGPFAAALALQCAAG